MTKVRPKDVVYTSDCGCVVTMFAATEYYDHLYTACHQHADRWNAGREPIIAAAKAEVERIVQRG